MPRKKLKVIGLRPGGDLREENRGTEDEGRLHCNWKGGGAVGGLGFILLPRSCRIIQIITWCGRVAKLVKAPV